MMVSSMSSVRAPRTTVRASTCGWIALALLANLAGCSGAALSNSGDSPEAVPPLSDLTTDSSALLGLPAGVIRTPDSRFANLPDYPWQPKYVKVNGLRMHYVEDGPANGPVLVLLHGQPTWSYLYRKMIPIFVKAGYHVYAPDLVGFGRSDKYKKPSDYTIQMHVNQVEGLLKALGLNSFTAVIQDWGSCIGLRVLGLHPDWFQRVAIGDGFLPNNPAFKPSNMPVVDVTGPSTNPNYAAPYSPLYSPQPNISLPPYPNWATWTNYVANVNPFYVSIPVQQMTVLDLSPGILAAYDAPFPDESYMAGARVFPSLAGTESTQNKAAWSILTKYTKPFLTAYGDHDPILGDNGIIFRSLVPGAAGQPHATIVDAAHFLQEDKGEVWANYVVSWLSK
jgi:haloalkane dehalogenase